MSVGAPQAPLAVLRRLLADGEPLAPVHASTHARLTDVEAGRCSAAMPVVSDDAVLESVLVMADFVLGTAYSSTLAAGARIVTVRLGIQLLGRVGAGGGLRATGVLDGASAGVGLSSATIADADGRPVARAAGRNAVIVDEVADTYGAERVTWSARALPWSMLVPHRGEDPTRDGTTLVSWPDRTALNSAGVVQGGALAGLAARGLAHALDVLPDDFSVSFVRPVRADGRPVTCRVVVDHRGRHLRVGRAELVDDTGRLLVTASGTSFRSS